MEKPDIETRVAEIRAALLDSRRGQITGSQLQALISSVAPELNVREIVGIPIGPGALKLFVESHLSEALERSGNQGGDILYSIKGNSPAITHADSGASVWKTFVSPAAPYRLFLNQAEEILSARKESASKESGEVEIPKTSTEEHTKIRMEFQSTLDSKDTDTLKSLGALDVEFSSWFNFLQQRTPKLYSRWGVFRIDKLLELFRERLADLGIEHETQQKLVKQIALSQRKAYTQQKQLNTEDSRTAIPKLATTNYNTQQVDLTTAARALAHKTVDLMGYDHLRALRVPLGLLFDAIHQQN